MATKVLKLGEWDQTLSNGHTLLHTLFHHPLDPCPAVGFILSLWSRSVVRLGPAFGEKMYTV